MEFISGIRLKDIFSDNNNWLEVLEKNKERMREPIIVNVNKMLTCRTEKLGFHYFVCPNCGTTKQVPHSCKSRFCSSCGKKATDEWIKKNMSVLPDTEWQHITFTMPDKLWNLFLFNRHLLNQIPQIAINIIKEFAKKRKKALVGIYVAIHTFGRDLKYNVHLHLSVTRGGLGINDFTKWITNIFFPIKVINPQWKYKILDMFIKAYQNGNMRLPNSMNHIKDFGAFNSWLNVLRSKKWVVHFGKPSTEKKRNIEYLGKYLKRPPLGETRIMKYDGKNVTFKYLDHYTNSIMIMTLPVKQFIIRLIRHISDTYFRCIRYAGFLANRVRGKLLPIVHKLLKKNPYYNSGLYQKIKIYWRQLIQATFGIDPLQCPCCKETMQLSFIVYPDKSQIMEYHQQSARV